VPYKTVVLVCQRRDQNLSGRTRQRRGAAPGLRTGQPLLARR
jgi:hypothetical protein